MLALYIPLHQCTRVPFLHKTARDIEQEGVSHILEFLFQFFHNKVKGPIEEEFGY